MAKPTSDRYVELKRIATACAAVWVAATIPACGGADEGTKAGKRATAAIATMKLKLRQRLEAAMANGPAAAVEVCAAEAQVIRQQVAAETGVTLGRSSLRLRTAADRGPEWVEGWLREQGERKAEGVAGFVKLEDGLARVIEPIAMGPQCLGCHGSSASLGAEVRAVLEKRYPGDAAVGYSAGDLRGAFWAELRY